MLSVAHAGRHHDTLITVEIKESPTNNNNGQLKVPSKTLTDLLNDLSPNFEKLQTKIDKIFEVGRAEHFDDGTIENWIRQRMEQYYSERTIRRVLPETAKRGYHPDPRQIRNNSAKMSDSFEYVGRLSYTSRGVLFPTECNQELKFMCRDVKIVIISTSARTSYIV